MIEIKKYQNTSIADIPAKPGLYAWYFRPRTLMTPHTKEIFLKMLGERPRLQASIALRYGKKLTAETECRVRIGSDGSSIEQTICDCFESSSELLTELFSSESFSTFLRPIYIGISKNVFERVYKNHYFSLTEYWDPASSVSKLLNAMPDISVQDAMDRLDIPHSFALEARIFGIRPNELTVSIYQTEAALNFDESSEYDQQEHRAIERLLQLLSDPIFGRR